MRGEEDELALFLEVAHGQNGADIFAGLQVEQALHGLALARRAHVGNLVDLEPVDAAGVGEAEQEGVRRIDDQLRDEILLARLHAHAPGAAAPLLAIDADGRALEVALMAHGDRDLLVGDQVFKLQLGALVDDLRAARVAVLVANLFQFLDDDRAQLFLAGQDRFVLGDLFAHLLQFVQHLVDGKLRQPVELQFEDGVDLAQREAFFLVRQPLAVQVDDDLLALAPGIQILARLDARTRGANELDDRVEIVERNLVAFQNVLALARLAQQEDGAALHHVDAVIDEAANGLHRGPAPAAAR